MHQPVDSQNREKLLEKRKELMAIYKGATQNSIRALDYFIRFKKVEDWDEDGIQEHINVLRSDSRRFLKECAMYIKRLRSEIDTIENKLMDISSGGINE